MPLARDVGIAVIIAVAVMWITPPWLLAYTHDVAMRAVSSAGFEQPEPPPNDSDVAACLADTHRIHGELVKWEAIWKELTRDPIHQWEKIMEHEGNFQQPCGEWNGFRTKCLANCTRAPVPCVQFAKEAHGEEVVQFMKNVCYYGYRPRMDQLELWRHVFQFITDIEHEIKAARKASENLLVQGRECFQPCTQSRPATEKAHGACDCTIDGMPVCVYPGTETHVKTQAPDV